MSRYWTQAAREATALGPLGEQLLRLIAEHRVITATILAWGLRRHPTTIVEALERIQRRGLIQHWGRRQVTAPRLWGLTPLGACTARYLSADPDWDPRPVTRSLRQQTADSHDLALARLRLVVFRRHGTELVVQRGRPYVTNRRLVELDAAFREELGRYDRSWAAGIQCPPPREPHERIAARRALGLDLHSAITPQKAILIPDLFLPPDRGGPAIVEYEGRAATGVALKSKVSHLAAYQSNSPGTTILVVYPTDIQMHGMVRPWQRAIERNASGDPLIVSITSLDTLQGPIGKSDGGYNLTSAIPGCRVSNLGLQWIM